VVAQKNSKDGTPGGGHNAADSGAILARLGRGDHRDIMRARGYRVHRACRLWCFSPTGGHSTNSDPKNVKGGNLGERDEINSPGCEGGRRRIIDSVAAVSVSHRATESMKRRRVAEGGPEGLG
jgi:hypothetical protein